MPKSFCMMITDAGTWKASDYTVAGLINTAYCFFKVRLCSLQPVKFMPCH